MRPRGQERAAALEGRRVALLTKHGKERLLAPPLEARFGCRVELVSYDTDLFGTFTREVPRPGSQLEAARRKARKAIELSGASVGLASEGTFGPDPVTGFLPWNVELVLWLDDELGLEVAGRAASGQTNFDHALVGTRSELEAFARGVGFPSHAVVLRPGSGDDPRLAKDLTSWSALEAAFSEARALAERVFVETDMRAHRNPSRQAVIALAAEDLVRALASPCPACGLPGFVVVERVAGLPCAGCGAPTPLPRLEVERCQRCSHERTRPASGATTADPGDCGLCNP